MYILDANGVLLTLPANAPLPAGAHVATAEEVAAWQAADTVRSGAGLPAPKSPEQAALEHAALTENIAAHGGVATDVEKANLEATAPDASPASPSAFSRATAEGEKPPTAPPAAATKAPPPAWKPETTPVTPPTPPKGRGA